jgi:hypothetical protein
VGTGDGLLGGLDGCSTAAVRDVVGSFGGAGRASMSRGHALLKLSSGTLLRSLQHYGGPAKLSEDTAAAKKLAAWGGCYLKPAKIQGLLSSARQSVGVRQSDVDLRRIQQYAGQALAARCEIGRSKRRLGTFAGLLLICGKRQ